MRYDNYLMEKGLSAYSKRIYFVHYCTDNHSLQCDRNRRESEAYSLRRTERSLQFSKTIQPQNKNEV